MDAVTCPHCNAPLVVDARFCPTCGKATSPTESGASWPAAAQGAPDLVGREIAGRYRIVKKLGEGGMGAVYRAEQISLKRAVAVKLLKPELGANQMILRRFNAEAEAVAKLSHPNTVNIYDFGQDTDGSLFIAMELIEGRSLRDALQKEGPLSPARAISIAIQVAASLSDAHAHSIVHRDLKPDNVMLQERGRQRDVVRVLDFGIAKLRDENRATQQAMTQAGDMLGTPQYMAPEQIRGERIDGRTDVYALGCMIYEMVTGRMPYDAPTVMAMLSKHLIEQVVPPSQRRPDLSLPPAIDQLVVAAMAKDPASRPATMDAFGEQLQALLATLPADANRSGGLAMQPGAIPPAMTPVAPSAFQPPAMPPPMMPPSGFTPPTTPPPTTTPPPAFPPPGFGPPGGAVPTANHHTAPSAPATSRAPIWIVVGGLALAGAGVGVWFAMRGASSKPSPTVEQPEQPQPEQPQPEQRPDDPWGGSAAPEEDPDEPEEPAPPPSDDPWASHEPAPAAAMPRAAAPTKPVGTNHTPIPAGAKVKVGSGYSSSVTAEAHVHMNASRGIMIALAPLLPGTNDPDKLGEMWSSATGVTKAGSMKITSAGKQRPALVFSGQMNGVPIGQVVVLYIEPRYRVGVLYQAPSALFDRSGFEREVMAFFARNVVLP